MFIEASNIEVEKIMGDLTDENLLANDIGFINGAWEKIASHRNARKEHLTDLKTDIDILQEFQERGSGEYWIQLCQSLTDTAFLLEA